MIINREIIVLYVISSIFEIAILAMTFFDEAYLSLFVGVKLTILALNFFCMAIFHFSLSRVRAKKLQGNEEFFLAQHKKYLLIMIFLITESLVFILEYMYIHKRHNPYISLFKSWIFASKVSIIRGMLISLKKRVIIIVLSLFLGLEMFIVSDTDQFLAVDVLIIVMSYLLILFNLFSYQNLNVRRTMKRKNEKMKVFSYALFEEMFSHNGKPIFIIKNSIKSVKLEMINEKAASIFELDAMRNIDYDTLTRSFQSKFSGFSSYSSSYFSSINPTLLKDPKEHKHTMETQILPNTDQILIDTIKKEDEVFKRKSKVSIYDFIDDFRRDQKVKKVELFLKNQKESLNHYRFEILKVKHTDKNYFIFLIHDQSKIDEIENLKNLNEFNNRLLCSLSHEIKTPINGALPNLEILKANIEDDELLELLDISIGSLKILENSLDNIMAFNLMQTDQIFLSKNKFLLKDLIDEVSDILSPMIKIKKLQFSIEVEHLEKIKLIADYIKLKQVLLNILSNAIQFTLAGGIVLKIELRKERLIRFLVKDTGIGMDFLKLNNLIKKLKVPNQQNLEINSSGSCMGLLISEKLSILLGSEDGLRIESTLNEGSTFAFSVISNHKNIDNSDEEDVSMKFTSKKFSNSKSRSSFSRRSSLLKLSSLIEEKKLSYIIEHKYKKSAFALDDPEYEYLLFKSIKSRSHSSKNITTEENIKQKYNFGSLVKLFDHLDNPRNKKLNNPFSTDPNIKKYFIDARNHLSVNYANTEKEFMIKSSPNTYSHTRMSRKQGVMIGDSDNISLVGNGHTQKKSVCDCEEIMYVDDDAFNLLSLELILKTFNLKCCKVMNGSEALQVLRTRKCENADCRGFRLIFMDYQMPIMDGIETTKKIMEMISSHLINEVPIIGCTAFVSKDEILKCYDVGMKDVIFKPMNINLVGNLLNEWL